MYVIQNGTLCTMDEQGVIQADLRVDHGKIIEEGDKEQMFKHPRTNRLQQFLSNIQ